MMKNKSFLPLIEQILMIAFFAIAAAVCLRGFAEADKISRTSEALDRSVEAAENAAEILKDTRGDLTLAAEMLRGSAEGEKLTVYYDSEWSPASAELQVYRLVAEKSREGGLGRAKITVYSADTVIFEMTVGWQEGDGDAGK